VTARQDYLWLAAILLVAAVARIAGLNSPLWYDEILTLETHLRLPWSGMVTDYSMNHHYFHDLFAKASMQMFGESAWAIRLPAMLFGLAAIAATWVLARDIAGVGPAHVTALLLAVSYHHIWFSQNARGYTALALFSTIAMILFLRGMRVPRAATWIGFGLCMAAAIFTHLTGAFFFIALGLVWIGVLIAGRGTASAGLLRYPLIGAVVGVVVTCIVYLPLIPGVLATVSDVAGTSSVDVMQEYQNPLWTAVEAIRTGVGGAAALVAAVGLAVFGLIAFGGAVARRTEPLFPLAVALSVGVTLAILMALGMRVWPRFFFVDIGFLMLMIVLGVRRIAQIMGHLLGPRLGSLAYPVAVIAMVAVSCVLAARNYAAPKQDLAGAFALVEGQRKPGERIYAVGPASTAFSTHFKADWHTISEPPDYTAAMAEAGPVTFVVAFPARAFRRIPVLDGDRNTVLREVKWFPGTLGDGGVVILHRD
jgi:mannosyltransferase